jgi:hypothetical protein
VQDLLDEVDLANLLAGGCSAMVAMTLKMPSAESIRRSLAESLHGEEADAARSALKSSRRMRRLVADLLLLARGDAGRSTPHEPLDLAQISPGEHHPPPSSARSAPSMSYRSTSTRPSSRATTTKLTRLALNLIENALRHTPPDSAIWVSTGVYNGELTGDRRGAAGVCINGTPTFRESGAAAIAEGKPHACPELAEGDHRRRPDRTVPIVKAITVPPGSLIPRRRLWPTTTSIPR